MPGLNTRMRKDDEEAAGDILKGDAPPQHLFRSLALYEKGFILGIEPDRERLPDQGYTGINAEFRLCFH